MEKLFARRSFPNTITLGSADDSAVVDVACAESSLCSSTGISASSAGSGMDDAAAGASPSGASPGVGTLLHSIAHSIRDMRGTSPHCFYMQEHYF